MTAKNRTLQSHRGLQDICNKEVLEQSKGWDPLWFGKRTHLGHSLVHEDNFVPSCPTVGDLSSVRRASN